MKKNIRFFSIAALISLLLLSVSSYFEGIASYVIYASAFFVPVIIGEKVCARDRREREEECGHAIAYKSFFEIKKEGWELIAPLIVPTVAIIMLAASLTSLFMGAFGYSPDSSYDGSLLHLLVTLALFPAVLEELLFRYMPMKLLVHYSPRAAIVISAVTFGFFHMDIFQIPYAILAGLIFMSVDIMHDSVWPSVIIHFVNNALSLIMMRCSADTTVLALIYIAFALLFAVSAVVIAVKRKKYKDKLCRALAKGSECSYDSSLLVLPVVSVVYLAIYFVS